MGYDSDMDATQESNVGSGGEVTECKAVALREAPDVRRWEVLRLKSRGKSLREIGRALGISYVQARRDLQSLAGEIILDAKMAVASAVEGLDRQCEAFEKEADDQENDPMVRVAARRGFIYAESLKADILGIKNAPRQTVERGAADGMPLDKIIADMREIEKAKAIDVQARVIEPITKTNGTNGKNGNGTNGNHV